MRMQSDKPNESARPRADRCNLCNRELDQPGNPLSVNCGGDCLRCMNEVERGSGRPIEKADVAVEGSDYEISLVKLVNQPIKDVTGHLTTEFGDPVFKMCEIVFEDGTKLFCEGEHDIPYFTTAGDSTVPGYPDDEAMERLYEEYE